MSLLTFTMGSQRKQPRGRSIKIVVIHLCPSPVHLPLFIYKNSFLYFFHALGPVRFAQRGMPTQYKYCSGAKGKDEVLNNKEKRRWAQQNYIFKKTRGLLYYILYVGDVLKVTVNLFGSYDKWFKIFTYLKP